MIFNVKIYDISLNNVMGNMNIIAIYKLHMPTSCLSLYV